MTPKEAYYKAKYSEKRIPELEPTISQDAYCSYLYATELIKGKFILGELTISKNAYYSYGYARDVIKDRWEIAEPTISKNAYSSYYYAKNVIKGRFILAEPAISQDSYWSYYYALHVIKGKLPDFMHNQMILSNDEYAKKYIKFISKNPNSPNNKI